MTMKLRNGCVNNGRKPPHIPAPTRKEQIKKACLIWQHFYARVTGIRVGNITVTPTRGTAGAYTYALHGKTSENVFTANLPEPLKPGNDHVYKWNFTGADMPKVIDYLLETNIINTQ